MVSLNVNGPSVEVNATSDTNYQQWQERLSCN
jgi:hypothetical protein